MKLRMVCMAVAGIIFWACTGDFSQAEQASQRALKSVDLLTGFSLSRIHNKGNYNTVPFIANFNFDLKPLTRKIRINSPGIIQWGLEPYIAAVVSPDSNVELGNVFTFKIGLVPEDRKLQPYLKLGAGMLYMTQHTREQSTQFNFMEYGGAGVSYYFKKNIALTVEGRFRHLSNSGIDHPNHGINSVFILSGITYKF